MISWNSALLDCREEAYNKMSSLSIESREKNDLLEKLIIGLSIYITYIRAIKERNKHCNVLILFR